MWERYARNTAHRESEADYFPGQVFGRAAEWIEHNHTLDDFFLLIDCFDPHEPFDPPPEYVELYSPGYVGEALLWPRYGVPATHGYSAAEVRHCHALYCGEITLVDRWLGRFLDKVEEKGLLANTAIIVTSDHGFLFGEHNWLGKHSPTLYQPIVQTPLIVYHPYQAQAGRRVNALAQMLDLQPTVLECVGIPPAKETHGRSLVPLVTGPDDTQTRDVALFGVFGGSVYATDGDWVFVKRPVAPNAPLNWYTRSHFNQWEFGQISDLQVTQQRLAHFKDGRFPATSSGDMLNHGGPSSVAMEPHGAVAHKQLGDELYDVAADDQQTENVAAQQPERVEHLKQAIAAYVRTIQAPEEQLDRLGLRSAT